MITPDGDARILDLGLARADRRGEPADPPERRDRHARLRQPRAARQRRAGRPPERPLQPRLHPLLHPRRPRPVRGGRRRQQDLQAADGRPRAAGAGRPGRPGGVRGDRPQADGQGPRRPLPDLRRAPGRPRPLDRPREGPRDPRRRGRGGPRLPPAPARARRRRPPPPGRRPDGSRRRSRSATSATPSPPPPRCTGRPPPPVAAPSSCPRPIAEPRRRPSPTRPDDDSRWLVHFVAIAVVLGRPRRPGDRPLRDDAVDVWPGVCISPPVARQGTTHFSRISDEDDFLNGPDSRHDCDKIRHGLATAMSSKSACSCPRTGPTPWSSCPERRQQSVGQILRELIDRALIDDDSADRWS